MSVPHLDTRMIAGKRSLLFDPVAGFSSKLLKHGSYSDLFRSIEPGNICGIDLKQEAAACRDIRAKTAAVLRLDNV